MVGWIFIVVAKAIVDLAFSESVQPLTDVIWCGKMGSRINQSVQAPKVSAFASKMRSELPLAQDGEVRDKFLLGEFQQFCLGIGLEMPTALQRLSNLMSSRRPDDPGTLHQSYATVDVARARSTASDSLSNGEGEDVQQENQAGGNVLSTKDTRSTQDSDQNVDNHGITVQNEDGYWVRGPDNRKQWVSARSGPRKELMPKSSCQNSAHIGIEAEAAGSAGASVRPLQDSASGVCSSFTAQQEPRSKSPAVTSAATSIAAGPAKSDSTITATSSTTSMSSSDCEAHGQASAHDPQGPAPSRGTPAKAPHARKSRVEEFLVGRTISKSFGAYGKFKGTVIKFKPRKKWYLIKYEDGDQEEMDIEELETYLVDEGQ